MADYGYEWDETKRASNLAKHGLDFNEIARLDWGACVTGPDTRNDYGEARLIAVGPMDGRICAVVYTQRGSMRRIISLRKANRREQAAYLAAVR
jgi:uncharacterized DUF497 family protein